MPGTARGLRAPAPVRALSSMPAKRSRTPSRLGVAACPRALRGANGPGDTAGKRARPAACLARADVWTECAALQACEAGGTDVRPPIPRWLGIVNERKKYFIVLERMEGASLERSLAQGRRFTDAEIGRIAQDLTAAVAHAHACGVSHNDLRPANVLFDDQHAALVDFGLATFFPPDAARADFAAESAVDRGGIADVLLFLLYSRYDGPRTGASWREELDLSAVQAACLDALFAERPPYDGWEDAKDSIARAFPAT